MNKTKKRFSFLVVYLISCLVAIYGLIPPLAQAASLVDVRDTISTSAKGATANHNIGFSTKTALVNTDKVVISFPAAFNVGSASTTCPVNTTSAGFTGQDLTCTVNAGIATDTAMTALIDSIVSPSPAASTTSYKIHIETMTVGNSVIERADAMVVIIDSVIMSATVDATLSFWINGVDAGVDVNGVSTTGTSTATTTAFGTLTVGASSTMAQELHVATNATDGYTVTVQQNQELTSNSGDDINSFNNSQDHTGSTTPGVWANPTSVLDVFNTYGHMGLTSDDSTLSSGDAFGTALYAGLNGTSTMSVMYHDGPSDGNTQDKGLAKVAYSIMVGPLQEAGDYTNTLTYICTPQF